VRDIAAAYRVSPRTVRRWVADGLLKPRGYRRIGGSALEMLFTADEIEEFMNNYLLAPGDLDPSKTPKGAEQRAAQMRRIIGTLRVYAGKAAASKVAKRLRIND
jgi:DNA-binding transcriptional MerR regulator